MTKPNIRPLYTKNGKHVDDMVECGYSGAFICYLTELDVENGKNPTLKAF